MAELSREEMLARFDEIMRAIARVEERLDRLNGRTRENEVGLVRLGERLDATTRLWPGGLAGGVAAGALWALEWLWDRLSRP